MAQHYGDKNAKRGYDPKQTFNQMEETKLLQCRLQFLRSTNPQHPMIPTYIKMLKERGIE